MDKDSLCNAILFFEEVIQETDEIIGECTSELKKELLIQKEHFKTALTAMEKLMHGQRVDDKAGGADE